MASMLAPETLNFEPRKFTEKKGKLTKAENCVSDKGFFSFHSQDHHEPVAIQSMKIVVSNPHEINQLKLCLANDTDYYQVKSISSSQDETSIAAIMFSKDFFKTFLLQGELFIQSYVEDHERDDFIIIRPNGELMISVDQPTSERIGLTEAKKFICENGRALLVINLRKSLFSAGEISLKTLYKFRTSLDTVKHLFSEPYTVAWEPNDLNICPSTMAKFFYDNGANVEEIEPNISSQTKKLLLNQRPNLFHINSQTSMMSDENDIDFDSIEDWMGALFLDLQELRIQELAEISSLEEYDLEALQCDEKKYPVSMLDIKGIFLSASFKRIIEACQKSGADWSVISTKPSIGSLFLAQPSNNMKSKTFSLSNRTLLLFQDAVFTRSKRG